MFARPFKKLNTLILMIMNVISFCQMIPARKLFPVPPARHLLNALHAMAAISGILFLFITDTYRIF